MMKNFTEEDQEVEESEEKVEEEEPDPEPYEIVVLNWTEKLKWNRKNVKNQRP